MQAPASFDAECFTTPCTTSDGNDSSYMKRFVSDLHASTLIRLILNLAVGTSQRSSGLVVVESHRAHSQHTPISVRPRRTGTDPSGTHSSTRRIGDGLVVWDQTPTKQKAATACSSINYPNRS